MKKEKDQIQQWLDTAVSGVRFRPDREAVEQELREHLEDKTEDLTRLFHYSKEEAETRALETMGDAQELSEELARVHTPWLGRLWQVSKVFLALMCVCVLALLCLMGDDFMNRDHPYMEWWDWDDMPKYRVEFYTPGDDPDQLLCVEYDGQKAQVNGQNISLRRGTIWQEEENQVLYLYLRLDTWRFWELGQLNEDWLTVTDNFGDQVDFGLINTDGELDYFMNSLERRELGPFHQGYQLVLRDLNPDTQWLRLDYGWPETIFTLTANLTQEGGA